MLGGHHFVTYPIVKGCEDEAPLHVIHFDAHTDHAPFIHDLRFTCASISTKPPLLLMFFFFTPNPPTNSHRIET